MVPYKHILVSVDLSKEAGQVLARGLALAEAHTRVSLIHVVEPMIVETSYDLLPGLSADITEKLVSHSQQFLAELVKQYQTITIDTEVLIGPTKQEIQRFAAEKSVDLIVIGTHGRHGLAVMLGSTANAVLHGTPCDVLAVHVGNE